jgi:hypothetical protein
MDNISVAREQTHQSSPAEKYQSDIRNKILWVLAEYPIINNTMLQMGVGPGVSSEVWRAELSKLIEEGQVKTWSKSGTSSKGTFRSIVKIALASTPIPESDTATDG